VLKGWGDGSDGIVISMASSPGLPKTSLPWADGDIDLESPNRNLAPISTELDSQGRLRVGGCLLSDLAARFGTPLYVLDELSLRQACLLIEKLSFATTLALP